MQTVLILKGVQASGKSTFAKKLCNMFSNWKRVNKDEIRGALSFKQWNHKVESMTSNLQFHLVKEYLNEGCNVVIDNTHLRSKTINFTIETIKKIANDLNIDIRIKSKSFKVTLEEAMDRNVKRELPIPNTVIENSFSKFRLSEILDNEIDIIIHSSKFIKATQNSNLPKAIICDIDGTIAQMKNRGPYEWDKVHYDIPKWEIIDIIRLFKWRGIKIILMSGRDGSARKLTKQWLDNYEIEYDDLIMRTAGDMRKDSIVKRELYDNHILGKYYIKFVLDDRDQVVNMWRQELGLTCVQVAEGNF